MYPDCRSSASTSMHANVPSTCAVHRASASRPAQPPPPPPPPPPGVCWRARLGAVTGGGRAWHLHPCRRSLPCRPRPVGPGRPRRRRLVVRGLTHRLAPLAAEADGLGHHLAAGDVVHLEAPWWCASCGELLLLSLLVAVAALHRGWLEPSPSFLTRATIPRPSAPGVDDVWAFRRGGRRGVGGVDADSAARSDLPTPSTAPPRPPPGRPGSPEAESSRHACSQG